jgi:hypothetical protein
MVRFEKIRQSFNVGKTMVNPTTGKRPQSNWAQITSAWVGIIAIVGVTWQAYAIRQNFNESAARQVYMSYSESILKYPEFTEPDVTQLKKDPVKYIQYKNFVSHMLFAYDEILAVYDKPEWRKSFEDDLKYQMPYLCNEVPPDYDAMYFEKLRRLLKEARAKCPAAAKS